MKRSAITRNPAAVFTRDLVVKFSDDPDDQLKCTVAPTGLTDELQAKWLALEADAEAIRETDGDEAANAYGRDLLASALCALVVSWDLTEEDGTAIEPTPEGLAALGLFELVNILAGIQQEVAAVPFGKTSKPSGSSGPTARKPRRR